MQRNEKVDAEHGTLLPNNRGGVDRTGRSVMINRQSSTDQEATAQLQRRTAQLERELAEKEKKLLAAIEEAAQYKSEATQKTKLVVQLQKQLVEKEQTTKQSLQSTGSLFGTLFGVAAGELSELDRLKREVQVQQEELLNKVRQNEQLRIEFDEYRRESEHEKRSFTVLLENEVKSKQQLEKKYVSMTENYQRVKSHLEILKEESAQKGTKEHTLLKDLDALRAKCAYLERFLHRFRESELFSLNSGGSALSALSMKMLDYDREIYLCINDAAHWLLLLAVENSQDEAKQRAIRACFEILHKEIPEIIYDMDPSGNGLHRTLVWGPERQKQLLSTLNKLLRPLSLLPPIPLLSDVIAILERSVNESSTFSLDILEEEFSDTILSSQTSLKSGEYFVSPEAVHGGTMLQNALIRIAQVIRKRKELKSSRDREILVGLKGPDKPAMLQSDESLLHSIEDCLAHDSDDDHKKSTPNLPTLSEDTILQEKAHRTDFESFAVAPSVARSPFHSRLQSHVSALNYLRKIRILETDLARLYGENTSLKAQLRELEKTCRESLEIQAAMKSTTAITKAELEETRTSYDVQLRNFSDRIVELEHIIKQREDELKQSKSENILLSQIKKNLTQKS